MCHMHRLFPVSITERGLTHGRFVTQAALSKHNNQEGEEEQVYVVWTLDSEKIESNLRQGIYAVSGDIIESEDKNYRLDRW